MSGCELSFFADEKEVLQIIENLCSPLPTSSNQDVSDVNIKISQQFDRLTLLLCKYLEQPSLLNGSMTSIMTHLCDTLLRLSLSIKQSNDTSLSLSSNHSSDESGDTSTSNYLINHFLVICECIQLLCRVRGFKQVLKHFPHEVSHLELCVGMIQYKVMTESERWCGRYVLFLWLSVLSSIPFSILTLDSSFLVASASGNDLSTESLSDAGAEDKPRLVDTMLSICRDYLCDAGLVRDAAAHCIAALLSRPDMHIDYLRSHITFTRQVLDLWLQQRLCSPVAEMKLTDDVDESTVAILDDSGNDNDNDVEMIIETEEFDHGTIHMLPQETNFSVLTFRAIGALYSVVQMLKRSDRARTLPLAPTLVELIASASADALAGQTTMRQLLAKLSGKVGVVLLPPREVAWAYARGKRSLTDNLSKLQVQSSDDSPKVIGESSKESAEDSEDADVIEQVELVEELIDTLLTRLSDPDTIVRWTSAKSLGRLALRLPRTHAVDMIEYILLVFDDDVNSNSSWHGGCLALAELARRNLIPPDILESRIISIIKRAIVFDLQQGHCSVGSNVRDAGCYLCWSLGHSYDPQMMAPHVMELGCYNLITAVFDREVNCRRAASAAFQENIGRQGALSFPNGLDIIAIADYQSLGNRTVSYLEIAPSVAQFSSDLFLAFQYHLRYIKLVHWDEEIRSLASKSLSRLVCVNRMKSIELLPDLIKDCFSDNIYKRHGCVLGCAEIIHALYVSDAVGELPNETVVADIVSIVPQLQALRMYRGRGTEMMRVASCYLIRMISLCQLTVPPKLQVTLLEALNENLRQPHKKVQLSARIALRQYLFTYFGSNIASMPSEKLVKETVSLYTKGLLADENVAVCRGYAQAIGSLPFRLSYLPSGSFRSVLSALARVLSVNPRALAATLKAEVQDDAMTTTDSETPSEKKIETASVQAGKPVGSKTSMTPAAAAALNMKQKAAKATAPKVSSTRKHTGSATALTSSAILPCQQDVETRVFAVEAIIDLLEASEGIWIVGDQDGDLDVMDSILTMLLHACDDYATDNRGDVGSWVRVAALQAIERALYFLWRSVTFDSTEPLPETTISYSSAEGMTVLTSFGIGYMVNKDDSALATRILFPCMSGGYIEANKESVGSIIDNTGNNTLLLLRSKLIEVSSEKKRIIATDSLQATMNACIRVVVKQLGEKLDTVRTVAGGVVMRLTALSSRITVAFPLLCLLRSTYNAVVNTHGLNTLCWSDPATVYPFLCDLFLRSVDMQWKQHAEIDSLRRSILSGLIISLGCINENIAKGSRQNFIILCQKLQNAKIEESNHGSLNLFERDVCSILVDLFQHFPDTDRITLPLLKCLQILLRQCMTLHEVKSPGAVSCMFDSLFQAVKAQYNTTNDVAKVKLCADIFVLYLRSSVESRRRGSLRALLVMLGHRLPSARKYAAEVLYLYLLSDPWVIASKQNISCVNTSCSSCSNSGVDGLVTVQNLCSFFNESTQYEEVLSLLTTTVWEEDMITARLVRLRLCVVAGVDLQLSKTSAEDNSASPHLISTGTETVAEKVNELDSYSYLVREEGR